MKDYLWYKRNTKEEYDYTDTVKPETPKQCILLNCIQCKGTYTDAFCCKETECNSYNFKKKWMKRPHICSDWFREHRVNPYRIQIQTTQMAMATTM